MAKVSERKMKRHEDGKRAASIGVEQFDEWKYIYLRAVMRLKGGDLRERGGKRKKEREERREKEREMERALKRKSPRRRRKYFHKIRGDDAFEEKPMLVLVRWIRRNLKSVLAVCRSRVSDVNAISSRKIYNFSIDPPPREGYSASTASLSFENFEIIMTRQPTKFVYLRLLTHHCNKIIINLHLQNRIANVTQCYSSYLRHLRTLYWIRTA